MGWVEDMKCKRDWRARLTMWVAVSLFAVVACEEAKDTAVVNVVNAWTSAGLQPQGFDAVELESLGGKAVCKRGTIRGVETTVCQFADAEAARAAYEPGLDVVGEATGLALTSGKLLLIVADRDNEDVSGRAINEIVKVFRDHAPRESSGDDSEPAGGDSESAGDDSESKSGS